MLKAFLSFLLLVALYLKTVLSFLVFHFQVFVESVVLIIITLIYFLKIPFCYYFFKKVLRYNVYRNFPISFIFLKIIFLCFLVISFNLSFIPILFLFHDWRDYVRLYGFILDQIYAISFKNVVIFLLILIILTSLFFRFRKFKK